MKHYIGNAKYALENEFGEKLTVGPNEFKDIPDSFTGDITYRMGVKAGLIQPFVTTKQGDKIEAAANAKPANGDKGAKDGKKDEDTKPAASEETAPAKQ